MIIYLITSKLDYNTNKDWEASLPPKEMPTLSELLDFINKKCITLEMTSKSLVNQVRIASSKIVANTSVSFENKYVNCGSDHYINQCKPFTDMSIKKL